MATGKKLYTAIAEVIKEQHEDIKVDNAQDTVMKQAKLLTLHTVTANLASIFANDNPLFDNRRFFSACGMYEDESA